MTANPPDTGHDAERPADAMRIIRQLEAELAEESALREALEVTCQEEQARHA